MTETIHDRWDRMSKEELRAEVQRFYRAWGKMQTDLYDQIKTLERRISEQRKALRRYELEQDRLATQSHEQEKQLCNNS
jgi:hypothetical protein